MPSGHRPAPPVGTARVAITGHGAAGNTWANVFWLSITATTHVAADLKSIIDSMVAAWATEFQGQMASPYVQTGAKASWLYASGQVLEYGGSYSNAGTSGSSYISDASCVVIDWSIPDYYRGGHPRTYLAGVPSAALSLGRTLTSGYQTGVGTAASTWATAVNGLSHGGISAVTLGTVRFASANAWLSPPVFRAYASASVRPVLGTQRRRLAA
jgi:hypothetical protein